MRQSRDVIRKSELVWEGGGPHASDSGAAIREIAYDAWTSQFAIIDRSRRVPLNPEILAPLTFH